MVRHICKAVIDPAAPFPQVRQVPFGAVPLHVDHDTREDKLAVWFEADPGAQMVGVKLWLVGNGPVPNGAAYVGSLVVRPMAWHVYMGGNG